MTWQSCFPRRKFARALAMVSSRMRVMRASGFDAIAAEFDRLRELPPGVAENIRASLLELLPEQGARVLDLGAGTGRVGQAFVAHGDDYVAVDASAGMLAQFRARYQSQPDQIPVLIQADGRRLPFRDASFHGVLMVQVISGAPGWRLLLQEARRVLASGGALGLGRIMRPPDGVDARMREQLAVILQEAGIDARRPGAAREDARQWLRPEASAVSERVVARWREARSPSDFLKRHASAARFAALQPSVRDAALDRLAQWARMTFTDPHAPVAEEHEFMIDFFVF
jgi:ubiquinone/menaquinone biosynthesis C-methylase UbiE